MINVITVQDKLEGLVALRQPLNPDYQKLDAANQASRSGYFATDNQFVKIETIYDSQDFAGISDADFNTSLVQMQRDSILSVCNRVFNDTDYIDRGLYYKYALNKINLVTLPIGFIGYKIQVTPKKNIAISIKRVLLDFDGTGSIKILVFNTAKKDPIFSKVISITTDHQEEVLDFVLDNTGGIYKGDFYVGYLTTGVGVQPFDRDYELSNIAYEYTDLFIERILIPGHTTETLFDLTLEEATDDITGLNFDITVYEDFTDLVTNNEMLFADAINKDFQINLLSISLASLRSNRNERVGDANVNRMLIEIEGTTEDSAIKVTGLRSQLLRSINLIKENIEKIRKGYFGEVLFTETLT